MDWFLYDRDLRHERVKQWHALEQARGLIRALQASMMVLLTKIVSNINLNFNYSRKKINLSCLTGPGRVFADGYITVHKFQMEICKNGSRVNIGSF